MRRGILLSIALLALVAAAEEPSASFDDDSAPYDDEETAGGEGFLDASPQWRELVGRLQRSVDADGLLRARRWGNIANGALLAATGPITFIVSVFGLKLSNIMLSLYVTAVRPHEPRPTPRTLFACWCVRLMHVHVQSRRVRAKGCA